jgi:hypothetical protein
MLSCTYVAMSLTLSSEVFEYEVHVDGGFVAHYFRVARWVSAATFMQRAAPGSRNL